jgi:hypothetical protein
MIYSYFDYLASFQYFVSTASQYLWRPGLRSSFNCFFFDELLDDSKIIINLDVDKYR